jgi:ABC-type multidrug transport system fused ATPase/permease subunit
VLAALLGGAARFGMRQCLNGVSRRVEFDLRNDFFRHLLALDASYYGRTQTGDIMSRATNDIQAVRMAAGPAYMYLVNTFVVSLFVLSLMVWIDPRLTLVALVPMLALPPVTLGFGRLIHQRFERIQDQFGRLSTHVQEDLAGIRIVKAYGQEGPQTERFRGLADQYLRKNLQLARVSGVFHPLLSLLSGLALVGVLLVGGRSVMEGRISVGDFVAFVLYLGMLSWPMIALGWVINLFQRGAASMGRINRILAIEPSWCGRPAGRRAGGGRGRARVPLGRLPLPRHGARGAARRLLPRPGRLHAGGGRGHRLRQVHAGQPAGAAARPHPRRDPAGRRADRPAPAGALRGGDRDRAAGRLPLLRHHPREPRLRLRRGRTPRPRPSVGSARRRRWRSGSPRPSRSSPAATTPCSASAG